MLYEIKDGDDVIYSNAGGNYNITFNVVQTLVGEGINVGLYEYTLELINDNYRADSITGVITITKATISLELPELSGTYYEDRIEGIYEEIEKGAIVKDKSDNIISLAGTFKYSDVSYIGHNPTSNISLAVKFTPTDSNYEEANEGINVTLNAVAYVESTYYGTVDEAISETTSGTIVVIPGTNPIIKTDNLTIVAGVTLFLPYQENLVVSTDNNKKSEVTGGYLATTIPENLKNTLTIAKNVILTNNGVIELTGQLDGLGFDSLYAGHTSGLYTKIMMNDNSQIVSNGTIKCSGFIEESSENNGSNILVNSGGKVYMPLVIKDFKGGGYMAAIYNARENRKTIGFNQYVFMNIHPKIKYMYGSSLYAWFNLYAGDKHNHTLTEFVGTSNASFIALTDQTYSYLEAKYDKDKEVLDANFYGGAKVNSLSLSLNTGLGSVTIKSSDYYFAIPYEMNISLNKNANQSGTALYSMKQAYKMLPGAIFEVNAGAKLEIDSLAIYEEFVETVVYPGSIYKNYYPQGLEAPKFIVNGEVIATNLGGVVYSNNTGAKLNITNSASFNTHEPSGTIDSKGFLSSIDKWDTRTNTLKLSMYDGTVSSSVGLYYSKNSTWRQNLDIIYENVIETEEDNVDQNAINNPNPSTIGFTSSITFAKPTSSDPAFMFVGWYLDETCTIEVFSLDSTNYIDDIKIYAKWIYTALARYEITYQYYTGAGFVENSQVAYEKKEMVENSILSPSDLIKLPAEKEGYTFSHWSLNGTPVTEDIVIISNLTLIANYNRHSVTANITIGDIGFDSSNPVKIQYIDGSDSSKDLLITEDGTYTFSYYGEFIVSGANLDDTFTKITFDGNESKINSDIKEFESNAFVIPDKEIVNVLIKSYVLLNLSISGANAKLTLVGKQYTDSTSLEVECGSEYSVSSSCSQSNHGTHSAIIKEGDKEIVNTQLLDHTDTIRTENVNITIKHSSCSCIAEGTLITMADGTKKEVQYIEAGDMLVVFNHETGEWDTAEVLFNDAEPLQNQTVINLEFSNGSFIKVIYEHGFFDLNLMKYVYITESNYMDFIGHKFVTGEIQNGMIEQGFATLTKAYITYETIRVYSPVTNYHLNYLTEDLLSMPGGITGLFNIFTYSESLKYDEELMMKDIEEYGLFTYEDFKDLVSEDVFNSYPTKYFKVAIAKGILTMEDINAYIERYVPLM